MRTLMLALCGLLLAGSPALAGKRGDSPSPAPRHQAGATTAKPAQGQAIRQATRPAARAGRGAHQAARSGRARLRRAAPVRGQLGASRDDRAASATAACTRVRGVRRCGSQSAMSWTQGLPPAAGVQAEGCPAGTMATLARGHDDIVRCMPI